MLKQSTSATCKILYTIHIIKAEDVSEGFTYFS